MTKKDVRFVTDSFDQCARLSWLPLLVARLTVGLLFFLSGGGKLRGLGAYVHYFIGLGIPAPHLTAPMIAAVEFVCGAFVVAGFFCRVSSLILLCNMIVAIGVAKMPTVNALSTFLYLAEVQFCALLFTLFIFGPGRVSVDQMIWKSFQRRESRVEREEPPLPFRRAA